MKTWLISDTHFYHDKMVESCYRPPDFHQKIIRNWNLMVSDDDLVIHLGDISWTKDIVVSSLPGRKILVKGNHDKQSYSWYMRHGFDFACESFSLYTGGLSIIFSHKPLINHGHDINIHGHLHNRPVVDPVGYYRIAVEYSGYKPVLLSNLLPILAKGANKDNA